jgi:hypothetical protein
MRGGYIQDTRKSVTAELAEETGEGSIDRERGLVKYMYIKLT